MQPHFYYAPVKDKPASLPYGMYGRGLFYDDNGGPQVHYRPDDMDLYLLIYASEYILGTKDFGVLNKTVCSSSTNAKDLHIT